MRKVVSIVILFFAFAANAQLGGKNTFSFLGLSYSARTVGLGNSFITARDNDLSLGLLTPSLLNAVQSNAATFNHSILSGGINYGMVGYAHKIKNAGIISGQIRYVSYGKMNETNELGVSIGTFTSNNVLAGLGFQHDINRFISIGANLNFVFSNLANYNAFGMTLDLAGTFHFDKANTIVTALVKNAGYQFDGYIKKQHEPIMPEMQLGVSHKIKHAPFRISVLIHHLNKWDLTYYDPSIVPKKDPLTGDSIVIKKPGFGEKLGRHFTFQLEILITSYIHLRAAFDFNQRQQMKVIDRTGIAGFSFGFGLMLKKIQLQYGINIVSAAGLNNMFSISTNIDEWKKRETPRGKNKN
jgi:hypothetical protein